MFLLSHLLFVKWLLVIEWVDCLSFKTLQQEESEILSGGNGQLLTLGLGLLATALAATYVTRLAKVFIPLRGYHMLIATCSTNLQLERN